MPTGFLWGICLVVSMLVMFYKTVTQDTPVSGGGPSPAAPADD